MLSLFKSCYGTHVPIIDRPLTLDSIELERMRPILKTLREIAGNFTEHQYSGLFRINGCQETVKQLNKKLEKCKTSEKTYKIIKQLEVDEDSLSSAFKGRIGRYQAALLPEHPFNGLSVKEVVESINDHLEDHFEDYESATMFLTELLEFLIYYDGLNDTCVDYKPELQNKKVALERKDLVRCFALGLYHKKFSFFHEEQVMFLVDHGKEILEAFNKIKYGGLLEVEELPMMKVEEIIFDTEEVRRSMRSSEKQSLFNIEETNSLPEKGEPTTEDKKRWEVDFRRKEIPISTFEEQEVSKHPDDERFLDLETYLTGNI